MNSSSIAAALAGMNSTQIIQTLGALEMSGVNISSIDVPAVLSSLNVTQVEGVLASNSTVVSGLLQSLQPVQLLSVFQNFQNVTSALFTLAETANSTALAKEYETQAVTLTSLLILNFNFLTNNQLIGFFKLLSNNAALGTGSKKFISVGKKFFKGFGMPGSISNSMIPANLVKFIANYQQAIFGDYPRIRDIAPSSIFMVIFFIFTLLHAFIFIKNYSRGHYFYVSLGLSFYSIIRTLGFLLRIVWSKHSLQISTGLTSTIFLVLPTVFLPSLNLILAQRFFTWRHPVFGSHRLFTIFMYLLYALVAGIVTMNIISVSVQTNYFLSEHHFKMTKQVTQACSVLITIYSLLAICLVAISFIIKPTKLDSSIKTYQPFWIKSFNPLYFVEKNIAKREAELVSSEENLKAIRVIHSTEYHHETINVVSEKEIQGENTNLKQNHSIYIIIITSVLLFISDIFRCVSTFIEQYHYAQSWIFEPVVMYIMFGVLETIVNVLYIVGRIDLRFYKPDALKVSAAHPTQTVTSSSVSEEVKSAEA